MSTRNLGQVVPVICVGTTTTLAAGSSATVSNSGTALNPVLNFGIPVGADGSADISAGENIYLNGVNCINLCDDVTLNSVTATGTSCLCCFNGTAECLQVSCCEIISGNLYINGNIYQNGEAYETHAESLNVACNCICLREGATSGLGDEASGVVVCNYNGTSDAVIHVDSGGTWRLGETDGDPDQPILTRSETTDTTDGGLLIWDKASQCSFTSENATYDSCPVSTQASACDYQCTKIKGHITNADSQCIYCYASFNALDNDMSTSDGKFSRYDSIGGVSTTCCIDNVRYATSSDSGVCIQWLCSMNCTGLVTNTVTVDIGAGCISCVASSASDGVCPYSLQINSGGNITCYNGAMIDFEGDVADVTLVRCDNISERTLVHCCYPANITHALLSGTISSTTYEAPVVRVSSIENYSYTLDTGTAFDVNATYYLLNDSKYTAVTLTEETWVASTYYLRSVSSTTYNVANYDLLFVSGSGTSAVASSLACWNITMDGTAVQSGLCQCCAGNNDTYIKYTSCMCLNEVSHNCTISTDTLSATIIYTTNVAWACYDIVVDNKTAVLCYSATGDSYLVHTFGTPNCMTQDRIHGINTETRCWNGSSWGDWQKHYRQCYLTVAQYEALTSYDEFVDYVITDA